MQVFETVAETREACHRVTRPLGLVPTMGFLHKGHMALVRRSCAENASVVVSIFVNPAQFGPHEDYSTYPRDMESDLAKLEGAGVDMVFAPSADEVYPSGFATYVDIGSFGERLEGKSRPGHFKGVATVVCKLLSIVRPDRAYFGQKDAQQCLVVKRLNDDLNLGAQIVVEPTVRESDGLALSSRNRYLGPKERQAALVLFGSLCLARDMWHRGATDAERIRQQMRTLIEREPLAHVDYISVADAETLEELDRMKRTTLVSLAVRIGTTRLIDNVVL